MHTLIAKSWSHLQELLFDESWSPAISRYRSPFVFRGLPDASFNLKTSLARLGGEYASLERHLLRNFRKYGHDSFDTTGPIWHWLTMAQHQGLPTRLLDWTYSPFVAMHFATADIRQGDKDGVIWKVNYHDSCKQLPEPMREKLEFEGGNVFTVELLTELVRDLDAFAQLDQSDFFLFFEPPSLDGRIINQHALFSVASSASILMDELLNKTNTQFQRVILPAALKWEVRDKLDQANITERVLFPGLEGLSQWLKRHYSPRG
ncbi:FRG domain-containing protein [Bowmanella denitrificans]|uniref:FRG domain-containing protein n=1 Tax=Bowmanella denitrificans TaxID=366582 RepID=UPI000C9A5563|nr:FRG domain-containing protein [Bowmanella denitrificans]